MTAHSRTLFRLQVVGTEASWIEPGDRRLGPHDGEEAWHRGESGTAGEEEGGAEGEGGVGAGGVAREEEA